jgi:hypothetical protein
LFAQLQVEQLVLEELHRIRKEGFSQSAIDAAINTTEFNLRENNTGRFPRGLSMMLRAMGAWIYERDPYEYVDLPLKLRYFLACPTLFCSAFPLMLGGPGIVPTSVQSVGGEGYSVNAAPWANTMVSLGPL